MTFTVRQVVVKLSVSDMARSVQFYAGLFGFKVVEKYTINVGGNFAAESYMQLDLEVSGGRPFTIGLYKDIDAPFASVPPVGTVPSFVVPDIQAALKYLQAHQVAIDSPIIKNVSDEGYVDEFFFFNDPDNNSLVARQNFGKAQDGQP